MMSLIQITLEILIFVFVQKELKTIHCVVSTDILGWGRDVTLTEGKTASCISKFSQLGRTGAQFGAVTFQ